MTGLVSQHTNVRLPVVLLLSTVQPATVMLMFRTSSAEQSKPPCHLASVGHYINWLLPGIAQSVAFGASPTAYGLRNDRATGVIDPFRSQPRVHARSGAQSLALRYQLHRFT
jgi:hypothetical protein